MVFNLIGDRPALLSDSIRDYFGIKINTFTSVKIKRLFVILVVVSCNTSPKSTINSPDQTGEVRISRPDYVRKLYGFWLGQCIANWTGLVTEMDKIGSIGEFKTGDFYTRDDWGKPDQPNIWSTEPSEISPTINFVFREKDEMWGSDDDTDIEYIYQHLHFVHKTSLLSPSQIRDGWIKHIRAEEENFLWVSNQVAFDLMQKGMLPPETGSPANNPEYDMIDAQLTTEIFGLFAPARSDIAMKISELPIHTTARGEAAEIARFYVILHALASYPYAEQTIHLRLMRMAQEARNTLSDNLYPAKMYDFILGLYESGIPWEETRDTIYQRYQVDEADGYGMTSRNLYCNGCAAAGINFAASLVSLFYGKGDIIQTIKIGALTGWDSDNPTATWGGLLGFMLGKDGIEQSFGRSFANQYHIHRTRQNFPKNGIDTFVEMAQKGLRVVDMVVVDQMGGSIDVATDEWVIPLKK